MSRSSKLAAVWDVSYQEAEDGSVLAGAGGDRSVEREKQKQEQVETNRMANGLGDGMDGWFRHRLHQTSAQEPHRTTHHAAKSKALRDQIHSDPGENNNCHSGKRQCGAASYPGDRHQTRAPQHHHLTGCILGLEPFTIPPARKPHKRI